MSYEPIYQAESFLRAQPWYVSLNSSGQENLLNSLSFTSGEKGDIMLHDGSAVKGWYAVLNGLVKLQSHSSEGQISTFLGVTAGDWFGEGSVLKTEPRRYDVIALAETTLMCLDRAQFHHLHATNLPFNQFLVSHLNRRLGQAMTIIDAGRTRSPSQRIAMYLSRIFWPGYRQLRLSQEELGLLVGLSRQTVNRILNEFEIQGLVTLQFGRINIRNEEALFNLASHGHSKSFANAKSQLDDKNW
jgi:CRP/FNR family transcriptional regulator, cyclic AMP receptor protein